jgi:phage replication O-like protein O
MSHVNPQLEDGYTPVANPIMDALAHTQLTGREWRVLCFVLRKTYGWQKKADRLSLSQFVDGTGIERRHVIEAIKGLVQKKILTSDSAKIGTRAVRTYSFNKHFGEWVIVLKTALVPKTVKTIVPKTAPTISIETNTTRPSFNSSKNPAKTEQTQETKPRKTAAELAAMSPSARGTFAEAWDALKPAPVHAHVGNYNLDHDEDAHE